MQDLQKDIKATQSTIIQWITNYQKINALCIQEKYNISLQGLLQAIAQFDLHKIKEKQVFFTNQVTHKYIQNIEQKIKQIQKQRENKQKISSSQSNIAVQQATKKQMANVVNANKKTQPKQESFFTSIYKKISSKEKKSYQIILPDKQPKCYYDHKTRSYIFQGEEPQAPKIIPKPPSRKQQVKIEQLKVGNESSELNAMIAPPSFKRKGANLSKSKGKSIQQIKIVKTQQQPLTYSVLIDKINRQYDSLLHKIQLSSYASLARDDQMKDILNFSDEVLHNSQQINEAQSRLVQKCQLIINAQSTQLSLMHKMINQFGQSHNIYTEIQKNVNFKQQAIDNSQDIQNCPKIKVLEEELVRMQEEKQNILNSTIQNCDQKDKIIETKLIIINQLQQKIHLLQDSIQDLKKQTDQDQQIKRQLQIDNNQLQKNINVINEQKETVLRQQQQLKQQIKNKERNFTQFLHKIQSLTHQINVISKNNTQLKAKLNQSQKNLQKITQQAKKQKQQVYNLTKIFQSKQEQLLISTKANLITRNQQKTEQLRNSYSIQQKSQLGNSHQEIQNKDLKQIIQQSNQKHFQKMELLYQNILVIHNQQTEVQQILQKLKTTYHQQSKVVLQSQARLKALSESYKIAKEDAEQKCSKLQFQCHKLHKKLKHYKEEQEFNRSYIFKMKSSNFGLNNDSMISLQSDNEQLTEKLDSMQKQINIKNQNLTKLQRDLEDLLTDYQKDQSRQLELQKRIKQYDRNLRLQKQEKQQQSNKLKLLQLKLKNQKQKNQQLKNNYDIKIANMELTHDKKIKILKQQMQQTANSNSHLKQEITEINQSFTHRLKCLQDYHLSKEKEFTILLSNKQTEIAKLQEIINQLKQKQAQQTNQLQALRSGRQIQCMRYQQLRANLGKLVDEHLNQIAILQDNEANMNQVITTMLQKYKSYQQEEQEFKQVYQQKILKLQQELLQSGRQSSRLVQQLSQYSELVRGLDQQINRLQQNQTSFKQQYEIKLVTYQQEIKRLSRDVQSLTQQLQTKQSENISMNKQLKSSQEAVLAIRQECQTKKQEIQTIKEQHTVAIFNLQKQSYQNNSTLKKQISQLAQQLAKIQQQFYSKRQQEITLNNLVQKTTKELDQKQQLISQYIQQIQKISFDFHQAQDVIKQLQAKIELNEEQKKQIISEKAALQIQIAQTKNIIQTKDRQIDAIKQQLNTQNEALSSYQNTLITKQDLIYQLTQDLNLQKNKNANSQSMLIQKQKQIADIAQKIKLKQQEVVGMQNQEQTQPSYQTQNLQNAVASLQQEVSSLKNQLEQYDTLLKSEKDKCYNLSQAIQQSQTQLNIKDACIQELKNQIDELKQKQQQQSTRLRQIQTQQTQKQQSFESFQKQPQQGDKKGQQLLRLSQIITQKQVLLNNHVLKISQLQIQLQLKSQSIKSLQATLQQFSSNKDQKIVQKTQTELEDQQIQNLSKIGKLRKALAQKQRQLRQKTHKLNDLQQNIDHMNKIIQNLNQELADLKNKQPEQEQHQIVESNQMEHTKHDAGQIIINKTFPELQSLIEQFAQKQQAYRNKIEGLQKQILNLISLKHINKTLQDNFKALQLQNASLNNQKAQLLRSNSYLMQINQKLVGAKSPHTIKEHPKSSINMIQSTSQKQQTKKSTSQITSQTKSDQKSIFSSLSSFFLTPTERDRLANK